jgi:hypothetical protein
MNVVSIVGCIVGVVSCIVGVSTFVSAQITKAKQDGQLIAKIDQCVKGIEEMKSDLKEHKNKIDGIVDEHGKEIAELRVRVEVLENARK